MCGSLFFVLGATRRQWGVAAAVLAVVAVVIGVGYTASSSASPAPAPAPSSAAASTHLVDGSGTPVASAGCTQPQAASVANQLQGLVVGGASRWYLLTTPTPGVPAPPSSAPTSPDATPRPLVLDFHGVDESALVQADTSQFGALGQLDGFVVVTPSGTGDPIHWDTTDHSSGNPDLQFVSALLDHVEATQCIDTSRVYATGFSDGAVMASRLACTMSDRFAAIGAVSGLELQQPCDPPRAVPVIAFHGTADPILFFNGGVDTTALTELLGPDEPTSPPTTAAQPPKLDGPGVPTTVRDWAVQDGCNPQPIDSRVGSQVIVRRYSCPSGTDVRFYIVLGGGHEWPGSALSSADSARSGMTTLQVNATDQLWEFFQQFQR
jgi:polyhydroxybutyrate depolymerase